MTYFQIAKAITISTSFAFLLGCGPEANTRYGDEFWDPNATKEAFDPIEVPDFIVTYKDDTPGDTADEDWTSYITLDFTELSRRSKEGVVIAYTRGLTDDKDISDLIDTNVSSFTDTEFLNDLEAAEDRRLRADVPGDYVLALDFDVIWPNGNTVSYLFDDITFTVPGCQTNFGFYEDYINPVLADKCVSCHSAGDASTAMSLSDNDFNDRRSDFLSKIDAAALDEGTGTMLQYIFNSDHTGSATADTIESDQKTIFMNFISTLKGIDDDTGDARGVTSDFTFLTTDGAGFCFSRPATMVVEE